MKLLTAFEGDEIRCYLCPAMIVEMWRSVMGTGRGKRKLDAAFTKEEQVVIRRMYKTYCSWCLGRSSGIPNRHVMKVEVFQLMSRVAQFFGEF